MNLRKVMLVFGLLFAANAFAGSAKSICNQIGQDQWKCMQASNLCFWDQEDQRCEAIRTPARCARYDHDPYSCNASPGCAYDDEDQRCEEFGDNNGGGHPFPPHQQGCYTSNGQYFPNGSRTYDQYGRLLICRNGRWTY